MLQNFLKKQKITKNHEEAEIIILCFRYGYLILIVFLSYKFPLS